MFFKVTRWWKWNQWCADSTPTTTKMHLRWSILLLLFQWKSLTKRVERMQFLKKTTSLEKTIKETILFFFSSMQTRPLFTCTKKLFFFQNFSKLLETKLFKGDVFVFSLFNKAYKPILTKKRFHKLQNLWKLNSQANQKGNYSKKT